jgi:hypothetical protein
MLPESGELPETFMSHFSMVFILQPDLVHQTFGLVYEIICKRLRRVCQRFKNATAMSTE